MAGCLVFVSLVRGRKGQWNGAWVLILRMYLLFFGPRPIFGMLMIWPRELKIIPLFGLTSAVGGFEVPGAGVYLPAPEEAMREAIWCTTEEDGDAGLERCRAFMPVPGPLQTVQRAEFWSAILALQALWPCHLGIDNLNEVRSIGRFLDHGSLSQPLPLFKDEDLVAIIQHMILAWVWIRIGSLWSKVMLLRLTWIRDKLKLRIGLVMFRLTLLLSWESVINRKGLWMREGPTQCSGSLVPCYPSAASVHGRGLPVFRQS